MIQETLVITQNSSGLAHIAPIGIHVISRDGVYAENLSGTGSAISKDGVYAASQSGTGAATGSQDDFIILPFRPSTTLNNLLASKTAVINYCDDVRVFAGCLTGRRDWPLKPAEKIDGQVLDCALAHTEVELVRVEDNETRPKLFCKAVHSVNHSPFRGFNRAQYSVLEAAILISRLGMIPLEKIQAEIDYLRIGLEKTAGDRELEAWSWLMTVIENFIAKEGVYATSQSGTGVAIARDGVNAENLPGAGSAIASEVDA
ncbi:DUF447 domain-containing protein [Methylobacter sp. G7]|uniref:DUF447 domain-containing protein n=1 Tax=Methylobacter sp. G7 TaxID=3230117 RepID=UPI003D804390